MDLGVEYEISTLIHTSGRFDFKEECLHVHSIIDDYLCHREEKDYLTFEVLQKLCQSIEYFYQAKDLDELALKCLIGTVSYQSREHLLFMLRLFIFMAFFTDVQKLLDSYCFNLYLFEICSHSLLMVSYFQFPLLTTCLIAEDNMPRGMQMQQEWKARYALFLESYHVEWNHRDKKLLKKYHVGFEGMTEAEKLSCVMREWAHVVHGFSPCFDIYKKKLEDTFGTADDWRAMWQQWSLYFHDSFYLSPELLQMRKVNALEAFHRAVHTFEL